MDWNAFTSTAVSWALAAWLLPKIARFGRHFGDPSNPPVIGPRPSPWREWFDGLWLIAVSCVSLFLVVAVLLWLTRYEGVVLPEPFAILASRYLAVSLVAVGLYTAEFLNGRYAAKPRGETQGKDE